MKSSAVYEANLCTFVLRSETMISSSTYKLTERREKYRLIVEEKEKKEKRRENIEEKISTNSRYFLFAYRMKKRSEEYLVIILAVERKL